MFTGDRCVNCGSYSKTSDLNDFLNIDSGGLWNGGPSWFCSIRCYKAAIEDFIEDDCYCFDADILFSEENNEQLDARVSELLENNDSLTEEEAEQQAIREYVSDFSDKKALAIMRAELTLVRDFHALCDRQINELMEMDRKAAEGERRLDELAERVKKLTR